MESQSFLITVSKIGVAFAGIASIVSIFRHTNQKWQPQEIAGLKLIIEHTLTATLLGLIPIPIFHWVKSEPIVWQISSLLMSVFLLIIIITQIRRILEYGKKGVSPRKALLLLLTFFIPTILILVMQAINSILWNDDIAYLFGLMWLLIASGIQFFILISFFDFEISDKN